MTITLVPAGRVAAQVEMSVELVRKVAVVSCPLMRCLGRDSEAWIPGDREAWIPSESEWYLESETSSGLLLSQACDLDLNPVLTLIRFFLSK